MGVSILSDVTGVYIICMSVSTGSYSFKRAKNTTESYEAC
jgi:hypothetical protein